MDVPYGYPPPLLQIYPKANATSKDRKQSFDKAKQNMLNSSEKRKKDKAQAQGQGQGSSSQKMKGEVGGGGGGGGKGKGAASHPLSTGSRGEITQGGDDNSAGGGAGGGAGDEDSTEEERGDFLSSAIGKLAMSVSNKDDEKKKEMDLKPHLRCA